MNSRIIEGAKEALEMARGRYTPGQKIHHGIVTVEITTAGPRLYIGSVLVRSWLGCAYDADADLLGHQIATEIWNAAVAD